MEKIAEIEYIRGYIQVHAVIPEMVTKRLNHPITPFIVAGGRQKTNCGLHCVWLRIYEIDFFLKMNYA